MQPLTEIDERRARSLLHSEWIKPKPVWSTEVQRQIDEGFKCELEALLLTNMGRISDFVEDAIVHRDFL